MAVKITGKIPHQNIHFKKSVDDTEKFIYKDVSQIKTTDANDLMIKNKITQLKIREQEIIKHEKTHMAVGGNLASNASYVYTTGPDGRRYISGGQVNMKLPSAGNLNTLLNGLRRIKSAASAVVNPSGTDIQTAAMASAIESSVLKEISLKKRDEAYQRNMELSHKPKINPNLPHIDQLIEKSYVSKLSTMKFRRVSRFEMYV